MPPLKGYTPLSNPSLNVEYCSYCKQEESAPATKVGKLVACVHCGLLRPFPRVSIEASRVLLVRRYNERQVAESLPNPNKFHAANQHEIQFILDSMPKPQNALDVGTADGNFVFSLLQNGISATGIEPYRGYVEVAILNGLPVHNAAFDESSLKGIVAPQSLDLLTLRESIYYMHDLKEFFRLARQVLKPRGYIYIKMHVANSIYYDIGRKDCTARMGEFISFIATSQVLRTLLEREGFQIVSQRRIHLDVLSAIRPGTPSLVARVAAKLAAPILSLLGKEDRIMLLVRALPGSSPASSAP